MCTKFQSSSPHSSWEKCDETISFEKVTEWQNHRMAEGQGKSSIAPTFWKEGYNEGSQTKAWTTGMTWPSPAAWAISFWVQAVALRQSTNLHSALNLGYYCLSSNVRPRNISTVFCMQVIFMITVTLSYFVGASNRKPTPVRNRSDVCF